MTGPQYFQLRDFGRALNADVVKKAKRSGGTVPWIKDYAGQLEDPEYTMLTLAERGLLKDLRLLAARRGNKILDDESYLRSQLRCSPRTALVPKLHRLRALAFLEPYDPATETPANTPEPSRDALDDSETDSRLEVVLRTTEKNSEPDREEPKNKPPKINPDDRNTWPTCPLCPVKWPTWTRIREHLNNNHWDQGDEAHRDQLVAAASDGEWDLSRANRGDGHHARVSPSA